MKPSLEVFVADPFTGSKIVGEYRGELVRNKDGWAKYKVYSPYFDNTRTSDRTNQTQLEAFRWVQRIDVLGQPPRALELEKHLDTKMSALSFDSSDFPSNSNS